MSNDSRRDEPAAPTPRRAGGRKPYHPPVLTEYGSISKLTRSGGSTRAEASVAMMRSGK